MIGSPNDYILEVGNLADTEAADNADFNVLEVPPGDVARNPPSHPNSLVSWRPMLFIYVIFIVKSQDFG